MRVWDMLKIKVAVIEDDPDFLKAISTFIDNQDDMIAIASATTPDEALSLIPEYGIDVYLIDISLNDENLDGIKLTAMMRAQSSVPIIMLTCLCDETIVENAFTAGANNYVIKDDYKRIPDVVRNVFKNKFNPVEILAKRCSFYKQENVLSLLTASEVEVYALLNKGLKRHEIARLLGKNQNTIKTQIKNIKKKLKKHGTLLEFCS